MTTYQKTQINKTRKNHKMMNIGQKCSQTILDLSKKIGVNLRLCQNLHHLQSNHVNKVPLALGLSKSHRGNEDISSGALKR